MGRGSLVVGFGALCPKGLRFWIPP